MKVEYHNIEQLHPAESAHQKVAEVMGMDVLHYPHVGRVGIVNPETGSGLVFTPEQSNEFIQKMNTQPLDAVYLQSLRDTLSGIKVEEAVNDKF